MEYGIKVFPTIKVFTPGKPPLDYQGVKDSKPIAEFAIQQLKIVVKDRLNGKTRSNKKSLSSSSIKLTSRKFNDIVLKSKDQWSNVMFPSVDAAKNLL